MFVSIGIMEQPISLVEKYHIGALERLTGKYRLPCISFLNYDCICLDCKQPVDFIPYGSVELGDCKIQHRNIETTCLLYTSPSEKQIVHDALYKLLYFLKTRNIKQVYHSCNFYTWEEDDCCDYVRFFLDLKPDDIYTLDFIHNSLTISSAAAAAESPSVVKYKIFVIDHYSNRPNYPEPNVFYTHADALTIYAPEYLPLRDVDRISIFNCGAICDTCTKVRNNLPRLANIEKLNRRPVRVLPTYDYDECPPCIACNEAQYIPVYYGGYRRICRSCVAAM